MKFSKPLSVCLSVCLSLVIMACSAVEQSSDEAVNSAIKEYMTVLNDFEAQGLVTVSGEGFRTLSDGTQVRNFDSLVFASATAESEFNADVRAILDTNGIDASSLAANPTSRGLEPWRYDFDKTATVSFASGYNCSITVSEGWRWIFWPFSTQRGVVIRSNDNNVLLNRVQEIKLKMNTTSYHIWELTKSTVYALSGINQVSLEALAEVRASFDNPWTGLKVSNLYIDHYFPNTNTSETAIFNTVHGTY